jgi:hypothetical protein
VSDAHYLLNKKGSLVLLCDMMHVPDIYVVEGARKTYLSNYWYLDCVNIIILLVYCWGMK